MSDMVKGRLKAGAAKNGFVEMWAVDEHGCVLHCEPVCTVPVPCHQWFIDLLEAEPPLVLFPSLLEHDRFGLGYTPGAPNRSPEDPDVVRLDERPPFRSP